MKNFSKLFLILILLMSQVFASSEIMANDPIAHLVEEANEERARLLEEAGELAHLFEVTSVRVHLKSQDINGDPLGSHYICATNDCAQRQFFPNEYESQLKIGQEVYFINGSKGIIKYIVFGSDIYSPVKDYEALLVEVNGHLVRGSTFTEKVDIVQYPGAVRTGCLQNDLYSHFVKNDSKSFKLIKNGQFPYAGPTREVFTKKEYFEIALRNSLNSDYSQGCGGGFSESDINILRLASSTDALSLDSILDVDKSRVDGLLKILHYVKKETDMNYNQFDHPSY